MRPPRFFEWLLRRSLPPGAVGDSIRGDLVEELEVSGNTAPSRIRYRARAMSIVLRYAFRHERQRVAEPQRQIMIEMVGQELKYAVRSLTKRPAFALMVVATLSLGIGANTAIFSLLHALVLQSLPVADPDRLVVVSRNQLSLQYPLFRHFETHTTRLDGLLAFRTAPLRYTNAGSTERITGALVSGSYFDVLGVRPFIGTAIGRDDDTIPGSGGPRGPVVVISHGFWQRRFGGRIETIGTSIALNGRPFTIIGVTPQGFAGTEVGQSPDVFAPMMMQGVLMPAMGSALTQPRNNWLRMIGRVKRGVEMRQAEEELTALLRTYNEDIVRDPAAEKLGESWRRNLLNQRIMLLPGAGGISGLRTRYSTPLTVVMAVMGLVLLIACANVANLMLGRAAARRREIAIRLGLGASRHRIIGQLLIESTLLAAAGGGAGLLLARWGRALLLTYLPIDHSLEAPIDPAVLAFTVAVSAAAALAFGLVPAWQSARVDVAPVLKGGEMSKEPRAPFRIALVVVQVSLSLVIVIGAALFLRSLHALLSVETGFDRSNGLVASIDVAPDRAMDIHSRLLEELQRLPGVTSAALADSGPLGTSTGWNIYVPDYVPKANEPTSSPWVALISPGYFKTMTVPLLAGRDFDQRDIASKRNVLIVNETFAKHYFGAENPVGRFVGLDRGVFDVEIIGVVKDTKATGVREDPIRMVYVPYRPGPWASSFTVLLRTTGNPSSVAALLRQKVAEIDPQAPVFNIRTVEEEVGRSLLRERLVATITSLFGLLALLLASIGLYGVLSYAVTRRTRELGVRIAVGASGRSILWLVLREAGWIVGLGIVIGLGATWALGRVVQALLYDIAPSDALSTVVAVVVLSVAGVLAAWIPARRASRIDPIRALRYE